MIYGLRTSLFIALGAAVLTTVIGVTLGIVAGYLGGVVDAVIGWITDFALALPFLIVALARDPHVRAALLRAARRGTRLVRGGGADRHVRHVRLDRHRPAGPRAGDRRCASGSSSRRPGPAARGLPHILFRQLLPNIWAPILVSFSLAVPAYVTGEAALSFLGIGLPRVDARASAG